MSTEILNEDDFKIILQQKFNTKDIQFLKAEWTSLSDNIEGFMGDHYILGLTYQIDNSEKIQKFFVKTRIVKSQTQRDLINADLYDKEVFLYNFLFKEFEKMGYESSFAPTSYYCKGNTTLVLEDLRERDFKLFERGEFYDIDHCKAAIKALANYHANCIAYEETKSKELGRKLSIKDIQPSVFNEVFFIPDDKGDAIRFLNSTKAVFIAISKLMSVSDDWQKSFEEKLNKFDCATQFNKDISSRKTCGHGDLWSNNMLFKYEKNGILNQCCLVDYQLIRYHHPAYDTLLIIYSNTSRNCRKQNLSFLLKYYYDTFEMFLKKYGFEAGKIISKEEFDIAVKILEPVALLQGAATRTFTNLPKEMTNEAVQSDGDDLINLMYEGRVAAAVNGFHANEKFRKCLIDDCYDLYEHL